MEQDRAEAFSDTLQRLVSEGRGGGTPRVLTEQELADGGAEFVLDAWYQLFVYGDLVAIPASEVERDGPLPDGDELSRVLEVVRRLPAYFAGSVLDGLREIDVSIEKFPEPSWGFRRIGSTSTWEEFGHPSRRDALRQVLRDHGYLLQEEG